MQVHGAGCHEVRTAVYDALAHHGVAEGDADLVHKLPQHVGRQLAVRARANHQQWVATRLRSRRKEERWSVQCVRLIQCVDLTCLPSTQQTDTVCALRLHLQASASAGDPCCDTCLLASQRARCRDMAIIVARCK